jgi:multiple sugar transport system substrate-binding protein
MIETAMDRRAALLGGAGLALAGLSTSRRARAAEKAAPFTVVINTSPWFDGFRGVVEQYQKETGNQVTLDVNPYAGSLEKQRSSVRASVGQFDLLIMNGLFYPEMYFGGFVVPLNEIDPAFKLDPSCASFDDTIYWDEKTKTCNAKTGKLMSMPINPNIPLLYYRTDLYEKRGLKVPQTWDELYANAKALHDPPRTYGIVQRGVRGPADVSYDWFPYLNGFGGELFKDEKGGDFTVTLNSEAGRSALDYYLKLAHDCGHPNTGGVGQAEVIQNLVTGKAAHAILVIAAWAQMDNPDKSVVVDKINLALPPHAPGLKSAPTLGQWLGGIARNVPRERQQAVMTFFRWFQTYDAQVKYTVSGAPPVRIDVLNSDMGKQQKFRWMPVMAAGLPLARQMWTVPEGAQVVAVLELRLNQAITGELSSTAALNMMASEILAIMTKGGYKTGRLPDLI